MPQTESLEEFRARRRLRMRRHSRRAYIRSVYFIPSMATLGNAICGFGAMYVVMMNVDAPNLDWWGQLLAKHRFVAACYLILLAMVFDALDGRLARWTRHTTDFGGQLDSLADVISFGAAPAMIALAVFKNDVANAPVFFSRLVWAIGAIYMSCAAIRLARFNVSNEHGEQHHMSFLGLPSPGAAAAVIGLVLVQQQLTFDAAEYGYGLLHKLAATATYVLPPIVLACGLLMISVFRYSHLINRFMRGRKPIGTIIVPLILIALLASAHRYTIGVITVLYALSAPAAYLMLWRRRHATPA